LRRVLCTRLLRRNFVRAREHMIPWVAESIIPVTVSCLDRISIGNFNIDIDPARILVTFIGVLPLTVEDRSRVLSFECDLPGRNKLTSG